MSTSLPYQVEQMIPACRAAAVICQELIAFTKIGQSTYEIDQYAGELCRKYNVTSLAKGQVDPQSGKLFPGYVCLSRNEEVTHAFGKPDVYIREGDLVSIDVAVKKNGYCGDLCRSFIIGQGSKEAKRLVEVTQAALKRAIKAAKTGNTVGDIGYAIESYIQPFGYSVVRELAGHTIGKNMWEEPTIPNYGTPGSGPKLKEFHLIAMDTMINIGSWKVSFDHGDGWTVRTRDGSLSCVFEDTFYVSAQGGVVLTRTD